MILYEHANLDAKVTRARFEILASLAPLHKLHCYSTVDALEAFLEDGLDDLKAAGFDRGLTRVVLVYTNPRSVRSVATRMLPGHELAAWSQPDAWLQIYAHIDKLREMARKTA